VTAYRSDRAGFERLRQMVAAQDETTHTFVEGRPRGASR
jgi:hypothetical protein